MKKLTTEKLREALTDAENIDSFLTENEESFVSKEVCSLLAELFARKNISKSVLAKKAGTSAIYLHQIFSGKRNPSRNRLLCLCLAMEASVEETQELLQKAGYASLYPRRRRDSILIFALLHGQTPQKVNDELFLHGEDTLF